MKKLLYLFLALCIIACANPGSGPDGGPYDETPPRIIAMSPAIGTTQAQPKKIQLHFDENIKLENPGEKVIVSPPQIEMPEIKAYGRNISVELLDTLKDNTTYTIDFGDAIVDNNEGNPMGQFTYFFSTGEQLDTMQVSGHVLAASDFEPVKGILVGLHSDTADSAFRLQPLQRVARTNGEGFFSIKGVAPGNYRIYALKDMDGDFRFSQKGEMIAFSKDIITPSAFQDIRHDTLWIDTLRYDTIRDVAFTHFLPDDLVLLAFTEMGQPRHLLKTQRDVHEWFKLYFTAPSDTAPLLRGLGFDAEKALLIAPNKGNDTITCWVRDSLLLQSDTLSLICTYDASDDSTGLRFLKTDTLTLRSKLTMARKKLLEEEKMEKWEKDRKRRHKRGDYSQETPPPVFLSCNIKSSGNMAPTQNPTLDFSEPLVSIDSTKLHLRLKADTVYIEAPYRLIADEHNPLLYTLFAEWRPGQEYELMIDSAAVCGLYGHNNKKSNRTLKVGKMEDFGALFITLHGADSTAVVQLMRKDGKVFRQLKAVNHRADFFYLTPDTYYMRLFYDRNNNGVWDAGNFDTQEQAEVVYYFPQPLPAKANWDIEQDWRVDLLPLVEQKPRELIKQKADKKKTIRNRNAERERNKR